MPSRTVLVTGGTGFVGRHLVAHLRQRGCEVWAVVRTPDSSLERLGASVVTTQEISKNSKVATALSQTTEVFHCAGNAKFGNGSIYWSDNVELTQQLIELVRSTCPRLERFVFVSTIGAVDRQRIDSCNLPLTEESVAAPSSDYGRSKLEAESLVRSSGLPFTIIRPTMVVGEDMRFDSHFAVFARLAMSGSPIARFAWPGTFSVVHVEDLVKAMVFTAEKRECLGRTYFCAGKPMALAEFFELCAPRRFRVPLAPIASILRLVPRWLPFSFKSLLFPALVASDSELRRLGWSPKFDARSALESVVRREKARLDPMIDPGGLTVITGAASGLGLAIVELIAPKRRSVLLLDKNLEGLHAVARRYPHCRIRAVDLSKTSEIDQLIASKEWNCLPVLEMYSCAGFGARGLVNEISIDTQRQMFNVNVIARLHLAYFAVKTMLSAHFGRVVFISSSSAFQPLPLMTAYAATNSAVLSLGEGWSQELKSSGIHLMTVCPGGMQTAFQQNAGVRELQGEKLMHPTDVAGLIIDGLKARKTTLIVSFRSLAMSLLARALPRSISLALWYRLMTKMR